MTPDLPDFLQPSYRYVCYVENVLDGHTVVCHIDQGRRLWSLSTRLRLYGIQAPENKGEERADALRSRGFLIEMVQQYALPQKLGCRYYDLSKLVLVTKRDKHDKYGRDLGVLYGYNGANPVNLNEEMLKGRYAKQYIT